MEDFASYYDVLGVPVDATPEEIKGAYRRLSREFHPDKSSSAPPGVRQLAEDEFKKINEAHRVLNDPDLRRRYDQLLWDAAAQADVPPMSDATPSPHSPSQSHSSASTESSWAPPNPFPSQPSTPSSTSYATLATRRQRARRLATPAMWLSIAGLFGVFLLAPIGLVLGFVALNDLKKCGDRNGSGKAIVAVVVGVLGCAVSTMWMLNSAMSAPKAATSSGRISVGSAPALREAPAPVPLQGSGPGLSEVNQQRTEPVQKDVTRSRSDEQYQGAMADGRRAKDSRQLDSAIASFMVALSAKPSDPDATRELSEAKALALDEAFHASMTNGATALKGDQISLAVQAFTQAVSLKPDDAAAASQLASAKAQALEADYRVAMSDSGRFQNERRWDDARQALQKALRLKPNDPAATEMLSQVHVVEQDERFGAAMEEARLAMAGGAWSVAKTHCERALAIKPTDALARQMLVDCRPKASGERYDKAIVAGKASLERGQWAAATEAFRSAATERPSDPAAAAGIKEAQDGSKALRLVQDATALLSEQRKDGEGAYSWIGDRLANQVHSTLADALRHRPAFRPALDLISIVRLPADTFVTIDARLAGEPSQAACMAIARAALVGEGKSRDGDYANVNEDRLEAAHKALRRAITLKPDDEKTLDLTATVRFPTSLFRTLDDWLAGETHGRTCVAWARALLVGESVDSNGTYRHMNSDRAAEAKRALGRAVRIGGDDERARQLMRLIE